MRHVSWTYRVALDWLFHSTDVDLQNRPLTERSVFCVTMHLQARARCDAHHTDHVASVTWSRCWANVVQGHHTHLFLRIWKHSPHVPACVWRFILAHVVESHPISQHVSQNDLRHAWLISINLFHATADDTQLTELLTGIRRTLCATPPGGMLFGHLADRLEAQDLHQRQQWAHTDQSLLEEKQRQPWEWLYHHNRSLRERRRFSSASGSQRWPAARISKCAKPMASRRSVVQHWETSPRHRVNFKYCRTWSRGTRDRDLESVQTLSEWRTKSPCGEGESAALRRLPEAEAEMNIRNWEHRISDIALFETNRELESQWFQLLQAGRWAD